ncbi:MAG: peptidoglycan editing factor PgeF [Syntrophaceae bacterium]
MVKLTQRGPVQYVEAEEFSQFQSILHGFCTRIGGVSDGPYATLNVSPREGDPPERVRMNWQRLASAFEIPCEQFFVVNQVHGESFLIIEDAVSCHSLENRQYDAIVTDRPGVAIGIKTADCAPVLIFDRRRQAIAAVHAGWRGTAQAIAAKAVRVMGARFSSRPEDLLAVIGPSIGPCCYEVDEPVFEAMSHHGQADRVLRPGPREGRWMFDLPLANRMQLEREGIPPGQISAAGLCTCCREDLFFSHRRDGARTGRHLNFILLLRGK